MAVSPPSPLGSFTSTIWALVEGGQRFLEHNFSFVYALATDMHEEWRRFQVGVDNLTNVDTGDDAVITFDILNYTGEAIDSTWDDNDYTQVMACFALFRNACVPLMSNQWRFSRVKAYRMGFNPAWPGSSPSSKLSPFVPSNGPEFEAVLTGTGLNAGMLPPQVAVTVTEKTPLRRHWGRIYVPGIAKQMCGDVNGRFNAAGLLNAGLADFYQALAQEEFYPVVPSTQDNKERVAALQGVTSVKCDDVFDVQRSRRYKHSSASSEIPAPPAPGLLPAPDSSA